MMREIGTYADFPAALGNRSDGGPDGSVVENVLLLIVVCADKDVSICL
jgi:hypothetical protein